MGNSRMTMLITMTRKTSKLKKHSMHLAEIPLLLSKASMKKAGMQIDFENDNATAFGESIPLQTTNTGLYHFPITKPTQIMQMVTNNPSESVTLNAIRAKTNSEIAVKLHRT